MASARILLLLAALAALPLAAPPAEAQGGTCTLTASVNPPRLQHAPGEALRYNFSVALGTQGGDVAIAVESVTPGWDAAVAPAGFAGLAGGQEATAEVLVTAPPASGTRQAQVTITARLTCDALVPLPVLPPATATQSQVLSPAMVVPAPANPADGRAGGESTGLLVVGGLAIIAIAGAAAVLLRPRGLVVRVPEPKRQVPPGGGASFPVQVENHGKDTVEAVVRILGVPASWKLIAPPTQLHLKPGATTTLQVLVRSPPDAKPGDTADLQVQLMERRSGRIRQVDLSARVGDGAAERPDVVVRDEGAPR